MNDPLRKIRTLAVTGGTGFVGQHLIRIARAEGYEVRALTRGAAAGRRRDTLGRRRARPARQPARACQRRRRGDPHRRADQRRQSGVRRGQCRRHRGDDRRRAQGRGAAASSTSRRSPRASRSLSDYGRSKAQVRAAGRRLGARMDDHPPARGVRPRRPRDARTVQDGQPRPRRAAAQGPLLADPCRGSVPPDPRRARRAGHARRDLRARRRPREWLGASPLRAHPGPHLRPPRDDDRDAQAALARRVADRAHRPARQGQAHRRPGPLFLPSRLGGHGRAPSAAATRGSRAIRTPTGLKATADWYKQQGWLR